MCYVEDSAEKASLRAQKSENAALGQKMPFVDGHYLTVVTGQLAFKVTY